MYAMLMFPGGRQADAILLSSSGDCLRFAVSGRGDVLELWKVGERWMSDTGAPLELGAMVALGPAVESKPRAMTA